MTVLKSPIEGSLRRIEVGHGRVEVRYSDGSLLVDDDATAPSGTGSVDIFRFGGEPRPVVVTEDRFRADARRWGGVRPEAAATEETRTAQAVFTHATAVAGLAWDIFRNAVDNGRFRLERSPEGRWELFYVVDPKTGEARPCQFEPDPPPADGRLPRFESVTLRHGDAEVVIADEERLKDLRPQLDPLYRRLVAAHRLR